MTAILWGGRSWRAPVAIGALAPASPPLPLFAGLTLLLGIFGYVQYRRVSALRSTVQSLSAQTRAGMGRVTELESLVAFGRALGSAVEPAATRQAFWHHMPALAGGRDIWLLTRRPDGWEALIHDASAKASRSASALEALANAALSGTGGGPLSGEGLNVGADLCFPLIVEEKAVGVFGVSNSPVVSASERQALSTAAALLAIAIRNGHLLAEARESNIRDVLTGCFTRAYALEALTAELRRSRRTARPVSALVFDVDDFRALNDRFGRLAGDAVLRGMGGKLSSMLRGTDVKCRYGADEFLVILPDTTLPGAEQVAASLRKAFAEIAVPARDCTISPRVSVGVVTAQKGETDPQSVVNGAYEALIAGRRFASPVTGVDRLARAV